MASSSLLVHRSFKKAAATTGSRRPTNAATRSSNRLAVSGGFSAGGTMLPCYNATMQVIPAIDLLGDDAVRLERGDYERGIVLPPLEEVLGRLGATAPWMIRVVDLDGARDGALRPAS